MYSVYLHIILCFLPTYTVQEAYLVIKADPRFMLANITETKAACTIADKHDNPFAGYGYTFEYDENGYIYFDPFSGMIYWRAEDNEGSQ